MIYIKEGNSYLKYHASGDGRLICTYNDGSESIILNDISNEFDAICESGGNLHFVLQGMDGELIYLNREDGTWKKYGIFKSRNRLKKIHGLRLRKSGETLCAFYIMEHGGNQLMVKHRFRTGNLYEEPEVLGIADARRDFCICQDQSMNFHVFFKNSEGVHCEKILGGDFKLRETGTYKAEGETLSLRCAAFKDKIYAVYTVPRKNSTALVLSNTQNDCNEKIITFGISRSCIPQIIIYNEKIIVQWEENGSIMQAESSDNGNTFTRPRSLGAGCTKAKIRNYDDNDIKCDICAVYGNMPYIGGKPIKEIKPVEEKKALTNLHKPSKNDITNHEAGELIVERLKNIENDIAKMGKSLFEICEFLDELKNFKSDTENGNFGFQKSKDDNAETMKIGDIGEIDMENVKLFESTDIDSVLPENKTEIN